MNRYKDKLKIHIELIKRVGYFECTPLRQAVEGGDVRNSPDGCSGKSPMPLCKTGKLVYFFWFCFSSNYSSIVAYISISIYRL